MALADVTDPAAVRAALDEFDRVGREAFLARYGFGPAYRFFVRRDGQEYDSKAVLGAAHGYQFPDRGPLGHGDFSGGTPTVRKLQELGFDVIDATAAVTRSGRVFGELPGFPPGSSFRDRQELAASGVHKPLQAGISYSEREGADSIVVSGGYEDDEDYGDTIVYTGHGGNDPATKRQVADQEFARGNLALAKNADEGLPVRVIRGAGGDASHSPDAGYRYDGLYAVERYWHEVGRSGYRVWRYRLLQVTDPILTEEDSRPESETDEAAPRVLSTAQRIVRSTAVSRRVKELHDHRCQLCGVQLETPSGFYAEGAHIRPLGRPHDGADKEGNILCLCPNDHVMLDTGGLHVLDDLTVVISATGQPIGSLRTVPTHVIDVAALEYHRDHVASV